MSQQEQTNRTNTLMKISFIFISHLNMNQVLLYNFDSQFSLTDCFFIHSKSFSKLS